MIKKYFKNNSKIIILLKYEWIKNNFETTVTNCGYKENCKTTVTDCGFKDIYETFKTTVTNGSFTHLKKNSYKYLRGYKKISLTNILRWVLFLPFFFYQWIILNLNSSKHFIDDPSYIYI